MNASLWRWMEPFGNSAILLPVAILFGAILLARPATRRNGWLWLAILAVECACVGGTKMLYMAWGWAPPGLNFIGLSGDSAMAFVSWPVAGASVMSHHRPLARLGAVAVGVLLAVLVSTSRVTLFAHSVSEAVSGGIFGALLVAVFLKLTWHDPPAIPARLARAPVAALVALLLLTSEQQRPIDYNAMFIHTARVISGQDTVYTRCDLGPWAALRPGERSCVPRGPGSTSVG